MKAHLPLVASIALNLVLRSSAAGEAGAPPGNPAADAQAVNALGLELLAKGTAADANALLSPYSIQTALAMTFAGAAGATRAEMTKVLHYAEDEPALHRSFAALQQALEEVARSTAERAAEARKWGGPSEPVALTVANRLFGQDGYAFRAPFLSLVKDTYRAPFQPLDFARNPQAATREINGWVEQKTRQRIRDLVPSDGLDKDTRLVLVNAIYLCISEVFHKTFLALDEQGTEAAAATAVAMARVTAMVGAKPKPVEVRVDHPFLFAIQHRPSGACLFLGRITEPR